MVIAYHSVFTTYGTWLPNDPRGSFSKAVYNAELAALGPILYGRQLPQPQPAVMRRFHTMARPCLARAPVFINEDTRLLVAAGFREAIGRLGIVVHECAIMNNHVHLLVQRSLTASNMS